MTDDSESNLRLALDTDAASAGPADDSATVLHHNRHKPTITVTEHQTMTRRVLKLDSDLIQTTPML